MSFRNLSRLVILGTGLGWAVGPAAAAGEGAHSAAASATDATVAFASATDFGWLLVIIGWNARQVSLKVADQSAKPAGRNPGVTYCRSLVFLNPLLVVTPHHG